MAVKRMHKTKGIAKSGYREEISYVHNMIPKLIFLQLAFVQTYTCIYICAHMTKNNTYRCNGCVYLLHAQDGESKNYGS